MQNQNLKLGNLIEKENHSFHSFWIMLSLSQAALGLHDQWLLDKLELVNRMVICSERSREQQVVIRFLVFLKVCTCTVFFYVKRFHRKWVFRSNFMEISKQNQIPTVTRSNSFKIWPQFLTNSYWKSKRGSISLEFICFPGQTEPKST